MLVQLPTKSFNAHAVTQKIYIVYLFWWQTNVIEVHNPKFTEHETIPVCPTHPVKVHMVFIWHFWYSSRITGCHCGQIVWKWNTSLMITFLTAIKIILRGSVILPDLINAIVKPQFPNKSFVWVSGNECIKSWRKHHWNCPFYSSYDMEMHRTNG